MDTSSSQALGYGVDGLIATNRVASVAPSPCGTWLAVEVQRLDRSGAKYVADLWRVDIDAQRPAIRLTRGDTKDTAPCFMHDGALAFLSDRSPFEVEDTDDAHRMQVWMLPAGGGEPVQLTDEPLGVLAFRCARAAQRLVLLAPVLPGVAHEAQRESFDNRRKNGLGARRYTRQSVRHWDAWLSDERAGPHPHLIVYGWTESAEAMLTGATSTERRDLTPEVVRELAIEPAFDIDAKGETAVCTWASIGPDRITDQALRILDLSTGQARTIGAAPRTACETPRFSPDGARIGVVRSVRSAGNAPRLRLAIFDVRTGTQTDPAPDWDVWPHLHDWTADGAALLAGADRHGRTAVFAINATVNADGKARGVSGDRVRTVLADGTCTGVSCIDAHRIAGVVSRLTHAPEPFVASLDIDSAPRIPQRLAVSALPEVSVEEIETASTDGTPIHAFLIKPAQAQEPLPLVMFIHGGPVHAFTDGWHWRWNPLLLVERGYALVLPNPRGSTGYGGTFIEGIWNNQWGAQCYEDLMAVADACCARPDIDASRTAAMGGSFGGYMTNWIGGQTDRFRCLITHASVYWMQAFTGTTDSPPFWYYEMNANADTPAAVFDRYSPHAFAARWKSPTLVIHGEKDYRCPISEGLMLFEALQARGVPSELLAFPDENHWILKPRNIRAWYDAVGEFLDRHLK